jgi:DNA mismatch repair protein MutS2
MGREARVMVITGANAGGKTIAIKTVGILLLMGMSGMPVPASSTSCFPLIGNLLVDIGDEQSIESSLSTFSAHISNITVMLRMVDGRSVVLIDELGTGTDPEEGAAIACAILSETMAKGAMVFATTHLSDIKGYVHKTRGMMNAAMEFDRETLTPLYSLRVGEPGPSHALQTARRYGLPAKIIDSAKGLLGTRKAEFDNLIADLNMKRKEYKRAREDLKKREEELQEKGEQIVKLLSDAESSKKEILAEAYREASEFIAQTKRRMHLLIEQMNRSDKEHRQKAIKETEMLRQQVHETLREYEGEDPDIPVIDDIREGDVVFVTSLGYDASVLHKNTKTDRLRLMAGGLEIEVPVSDIRHKRGKALQKGQVPYIPEREKEAVKMRLNIVGLRVDEALSKIEPFLNHSAMAELHEVIIIHGIGKGLLRRVVHEHIDGHPLVNSFKAGNPEEGGVGVTIAILK